MKRSIAILGTLLVVGIFLSGSAVAGTCHYAKSVVDSKYCTNPKEILGAPDGKEATLGVNDPQPKLGQIMVDLGEGNEMGPDQKFTVFAHSIISEKYLVGITENLTSPDLYNAGQGEDTRNHDFFTPSTPGKLWRYIHLFGKSGQTDPRDPIYGPDIEAVGWCEE